LEEAEGGCRRSASENDLPVINLSARDRGQAPEFAHPPLAPGEIVSTSGEVLGRHSGIHRYTVGQRRGLGLAAAEPLYVVEIDAAHNRVVVGTSGALFKREMIVTRANWVAVRELAEPLRVSVKIRSRAEEAGAMIAPRADGSVLVSFDEPQRAITPGQAAVFYDGEVVLGGGWIV
jgi:tRNA-specific 2-thiouridylase